jgi:hypothetical protein
VGRAALVGILGSLALWAPDAAALEVSRFGLKVGLNVARLDDGGENAAALGDSLGGTWNQDFRVPVVGGVFAEVPVSATWLLRPELQYARKGESYSATVDGIDVRATLSLDYVELPLLVLYRFPASGAVRPGVFAGPAFALEVDADYTLEAGSAAVSAALSDTRNVDVSAVAGVEVLVGERFFLETRVWNGFLDVDEMSEGDPIHTRGVSLLMGIGWELKANPR